MFGRKLSRAAMQGEVCTCGKPATKVYVDGRGEVGSCGKLNPIPRKIGTPCPFCGTLNKHENHGRCPHYRLHPEGLFGAPQRAVQAMG